MDMKMMTMVKTTMTATIIDVVTQLTTITMVMRFFFCGHSPRKMIERRFKSYSTNLPFIACCAPPQA